MKHKILYVTFCSPARQNVVLLEGTGKSMVYFLGLVAEKTFLSPENLTACHLLHVF